MIRFYLMLMELMMVWTQIMMSRMEWTDVRWPRAFGFDAQRAGLQHLSFRAMWEKSKNNMKNRNELLTMQYRDVGRVSLNFSDAGEAYLQSYKNPKNT